MVLTMVYNSQNCWGFGLRPSYGILDKKKKMTFQRLDLFLSSGERGRHLIIWVPQKEVTQSLKGPN
jgi:hypothetical protein